MKIKITVYKGTGKFYADEIAENEKDIPLWKDEFKEFIKKNIPAHYSGGYVTVDDLSDDQSFHKALYKYDDLFR